VALTSSYSIATYLQYACGHGAMVSVPRIKSEGAREREKRLALEKVSASQRRCDFCGPEPSPTEDGQMTHSTSTEQASSNGSNAAAGAATDRKGRGRSPLRRLSDEQELELKRLYSETETPVPEIARRFGVGESSVYRISQRHGARLRSTSTSRGGTSTAAAREPAAPSGRSAARRGPRRPRASAASVSAATDTPRGRQQRSRGGTTQASAAAARAPRRTSTPSAGTRDTVGGTRRYRVLFMAETVLEADTMRDAIAQAEARGATDIRSVTLAE